MRGKIVKLLLVFCIVGLLIGTTACSTSRADIKTDFCGVHINYQYCKCAFHNEYCDEVGMTKSEAKTYVYAQHDKWRGVEPAEKEEESLEDTCKETPMADCYKELAIKSKDPTWCEKAKTQDKRMETYFEKDLCYSRLAQATKNTTICSNIKGDDFNNEEICVSDIGLETLNIKVCDQLKGESKESCIDYLELVLSEPIRSGAGITKYGVYEEDGNLYINSPPGETLDITTEDLPHWAQKTIARIGATITVVGPPDIIVEGDPHVNLDGVPIARVYDGTVQGGTIVTGSTNIFVNGRAVAIIGGQTINPMVTGSVPHIGGPIASN